MAVAASCYNCHAIIDGVDRARLEYIVEKYPYLYVERLMKGVFETHTLLVQEGLIVVPDGKLI